MQHPRNNAGTTLGLAITLALASAGAAAQDVSTLDAPDDSDSSTAFFEDDGRSGKLLLTGGVSQIEGAAGGGLTPWAVIGGYGTGELDDTWAYDYNTNTWTEMAPEFSPGLRSWHSMAYDAATQKVVFFGGAPRRDPLFHDDTWLYDPSANTWSPLGGVVVGGVTLTSAGCEYAGPSEIPVGDLTFRLRQKNTGRFNLDAFLLDEGHGYDEFVAHIDEERRRNRAGEPHQGPPNSFASLVGQASAEVDAIADLDIDAGPGTYALACIHIEESGAPGDIWAAGPITVSD